MEQDTIKLLEEIDLGCEMAENSFRQIRNFEMPQKLEQLLEKYQEKHEQIQKKASQMLEEHGKPDKNPGPAAEAMSWLTTQIKMMRRNDQTQIAKLMMDGCNMGIQTIGEKMRTFPQASREAAALAEKLMNTEEDFMSEVRAFL